MSICLSLEEQKQCLLSKIGNTVRFRYPEGEFSNYPRHGRLKDRFVVFDSEDDDVVYWNIIDLIEFKDYPEDWLRVTYYRYRKKEKRKWVFAGQTSLSNPISGFVQLFVAAIKEKGWMREFFKKVYDDCSHEILK